MSPVSVYSMHPHSLRDSKHQYYKISNTFIESAYNTDRTDTATLCSLHMWCSLLSFNYYNRWTLSKTWSLVQLRPGKEMKSPKTAVVAAYLNPCTYLFSLAGGFRNTRETYQSKYNGFINFV